MSDSVCETCGTPYMYHSETPAQCAARTALDAALEAALSEKARFAGKAGMACGEADILRQNLARVTEERDEANLTLALIQTRVGLATEVWRKESGSPDVSPDLGALLNWSMDRAEKAEADLLLVKGERNDLRKARDEWIKANAPGGWIDTLRNDLSRVIRDRNALRAMVDSTGACSRCYMTRIHAKDCPRMLGLDP